jgi:hypothetical protein
MIDALRERLGVSDGEARRLLSELEQARTIRWVEGASPAAASAPPPHMAGMAFMSESQSSAVPAFRSGNEGYWQL